MQASHTPQVRSVRATWVLLILFGFAVRSVAIAQPAALPKDLDDYVAAAIKEWSIPGVALAIVKDGKPIVVKGYGVTKLGTSDAVTSDTIFDIASLTKSFTAAKIATLVDEGKLDWDTPVRECLPIVQFSDPYLTANVTLRDLLSHRTGLRNNAAPFRGHLARAQVVALFKRLPTSEPFRARWVYSNIGYALAGEVAAAATGTTWRTGVLLNFALTNRMIDHYLGLQTRDYVAEFRTSWQQGENDEAAEETALEAGRLKHAAPHLPLSAYAGQYRDQLGLDVVVALEQGGLKLRYAGGAPASLKHWHGDTFRLTWANPFSQGRPTFVTFGLDAKGNVNRLNAEILRDPIDAARVTAGAVQDRSLKHRSRRGHHAAGREISLEHRASLPNTAPSLMLFVALSSLQGRAMAAAFDELAVLGVGIQLTPGNHPTPGFRTHVAGSGVATRRHHGFAFDARRSDTWREGACVTDAESVHPPKAGAPWRAWYEAQAARPIVEVMYPGFELGTGGEVEDAMNARLPLAVDISHVHIQRTQGVMSEQTWRRLQDYSGVAEVHVSANDGRHDSHQPLRRDTFGLTWARERLATGDPVVFECYLHRLCDRERRDQLDLIRGPQ